MSEDQENLITSDQITEILYKNTPCKGCIYFFFRVFIYILILVGLADILGSILVYSVTKTLDWYNGTYSLLGIFIIFLASFSYTTRESTGGTCFYLFLLFSCFLGQLGVTLALLFYSPYPSLIGSINAKTVRYGMLSTACVIFVSLIVGILYYCMISKENQKRQLYYMLYGEPENDMQPIVGVNLWRKYEKTMVRWNRLFR